MFCKKYPLFFRRIDDILRKIEEEKSITSRWTTGDQLYKAAKYTVVYDKLKRQLFQLRKGVVERFFLLSLKSKYSGILQPHGVFHFMGSNTVPCYALALCEQKYLLLLHSF